MNYAIGEANGQIVAFISCPESQLEHNIRAGQTAVPYAGDASANLYMDFAQGKPTVRAMPPKPSEDSRFDYEKKQWVADNSGTALRINYQRRIAYPDVGDQLDALWKGIYDGDDAALADMMAKIRAVKAKYPKPP